MSLTYKQAIDIYNNDRKSKHEKPKIADFRQEILNRVFPNSEKYLDDNIFVHNKCEIQFKRSYK